ncbi:MAG: amidohydrolase [Candidatus Jordarchaeum sp.]|uniref:amidohydrolase n=1 Tax=Candidatus Jordarchaeum sp. TaxID=2823881 RepID=UPI00404993FB
MGLKNFRESSLCLVNGNFITLNPGKPRAEAVAIHDGKIIGVGTSKEMKSLFDNKVKTIDLKGKTVLPGFTDCHIHILGFGAMLNMLDLKGVKSIEDIKERLRREAQRKSRGAWIVGHGWDDSTLAEKRLPTRWDLDQAAPDNPVTLMRVCGHISCVNSKALELAKINAETESPAGGKIDKDSETNEPTGIMREAAGFMILNLVSLGDEDYALALKLACEEAVSKGLTSIHCMPILDQAQEFQGRVFQTLLMRGELPLRVYLQIPEACLSSIMDLGFYTGFGNPRLKIGAIKIILDGSLGGRTAAMLEPFSDDPENRGILIYDEQKLGEIVKKAHIAGFQLAIHCIGDRAAGVALDAIEEALREKPKEDHRHRIEHASVLNKELIKRMKKLGIVASVQPPFIVSDGRWMLDRVGEKRAQYVYPFKSMLKERIKLAAGSDCPVEFMAPLPGVQAAVLREVTPEYTFIPEERVSVEQAIRMYTLDAAYASFEENIKGSIEIGKLADMVILSDDPMKIPPNKIGEIEVEMTIVGGEIVYSK